MNELIKLDGIVAEGDVKLQKKMQVCKINNHRSFLNVSWVIFVVVLQVICIIIFR